MISLSSVTKRFGSTVSGKIAVSEVTFEAKEGEVVGFVGPNGAGKTTTMRLILGYLTPTEGQVRIGNLNPQDDRIEILKKVGYLPENNPLYQEMKVSEYLAFIAGVKGVSDYEQILHEVGLSDVMQSKIEQLSRGYKQRVGLASALLSDPPVLILDEPTSGLDPLEQEKIKKLVKKIAKEKTIIFSTHILTEVEDVANKLIIINKGKIIYKGNKPKGKGEVAKLFKKLVK